LNERNDEKLRELFEQFMDPEQAKMHLEDIERGEQILREHPAPGPDDMLLANIKAQIALHVLPRKTVLFKQIAYKAAAVAAAAIFFAAIWTNLFKAPPAPETERSITASVFPWSDSDDITTHDANLVVLTAEIDQIQNELIDLDLGQEGSDSDSESAVSEMENELLVIAGDFWKG